MTYRIVIFSLWTIWALYWIASSFGNKRTVYRTNPVWRIAFVMVVFGAVNLARWYPDFFGKQLIPRSDASGSAGVILCALGVAFSIWARAVLGRNWSGNP